MELKTELNLCKNDFTLLINTDGVPISKSSSTQLWPLQATINEIPWIPSHLRQYFMIVCCIWVGHTKHNMNTFLRPLCEELANDSIITWIHPGFNRLWGRLDRSIYNLCQTNCWSWTWSERNCQVNVDGKKIKSKKAIL